MVERCFGTGNRLYEKYHDEEWGVPSYDERHLFEMLSLEGMQAGLSWLVVLKKRAAIKEAFYNFDVGLVAKMCDEDLMMIMLNEDVIRNKLKIFSVRNNAQIYIDIQLQEGSFSKYLWSFVNGKPIVNRWKSHDQVPCLNELSYRIAADLKKKGMKFIGPKIIYSYLQAVGVICDHTLECHKSPKTPG